MSKIASGLLYAFVALWLNDSIYDYELRIVLNLVLIFYVTLSFKLNQFINSEARKAIAMQHHMEEIKTMISGEGYEELVKNNADRAELLQIVKSKFNLYSVVEVMVLVLLSILLISNL